MSKHNVFKTSTRRNSQGGASALRLITLLLEGFYALLTARAAFLWLVPYWGSLPAFLSAAEGGCAVFSLSFFALVHQDPLRAAIRHFGQLHGDDAMDAVFLLSLPTAVAVVAQSAAALALLGAPFPLHGSRTFAWGVLPCFILIPVYLCHRCAKVAPTAQSR
jgi:hypothetical protein